MTREEAKALKPGDKVNDRATGKHMVVVRVTKIAVHLREDSLAGAEYIRKLRLANLLTTREK